MSEKNDETIKVKKSERAAASYFECVTIADAGCAPKIRINADIILCSGCRFHHIDTEAIMRGLENAVRDATWLIHYPHTYQHADE